jgi:hypothetical protein
VLEVLNLPIILPTVSYVNSYTQILRTFVCFMKIFTFFAHLYLMKKIVVFLNRCFKCIILVHMFRLLRIRV